MLFRDPTKEMKKEQIGNFQLCFQYQIITAAFALLAVIGARAETISLYTEIRTYDPRDGWSWPPPSPVDTNWDYWQAEPNYPDPCSVLIEDAIYHCLYDGGFGHDLDPNLVLDGYVDGSYSTLFIQVDDHSLQTLGLSGCDFSNDKRDTRVAALFNLKKVLAHNPNPGAIVEAKLRFAIDWVVNWNRTSFNDYPCPTTLFVSVFPGWEQNFWLADYDGPGYPTTPLSELDALFDPAGAGIAICEKTVDLRVLNGPLGSGVLQPLTRRYLENPPRAVSYEIDFTSEVRQIAAQTSDPNAWVGFTIRPSLDGERVFVSLDAQYNLGGLETVGFPPTLDVTVSTITGDLTEPNGVNMLDYRIVGQQWGQSGYPNGDLNASGTVDPADIQIIAENWMQE